MSKFKGVLSYYGSKSKIAHLYPAPDTNLIVEPFAGSAAYAWLHRRGADGNQRDVWLNDLDPRTYSMWRFLTSADAYAIVEAYVPETVEPGMKVSEMIPAEHPGLIELCRAEANQGTQGARGVHDVITAMGARVWKVRRKLLQVIPEVAHWRVTNVDYSDLANVEATWFVDPPYSGNAGRRYRTDQVDYEALGWWVLNRRGQRIVCENAGANWGDFTPLDHPRVSIRSRYQKADAREVVWILNDAKGMSEGSLRTEQGEIQTPSEEVASKEPGTSPEEL